MAKIRNWLVSLHIKIIRLVVLKKSIMMNVDFDVEADCLFKDKIKRG